MRLAVIALLLSSAPCFAQVAENHKFLDKTAVIGLSSSTGLMAFDNAQTCYAIARGAREEILPVHSCAGLSVLTATAIASQTSAAYWLHRTHHHRLERVAEFVWIAGPTIGITYSFKHRYHLQPFPAR